MYYKVVRQTKSEKMFISATSLGLQLSYYIGEKTVRPNKAGPLAVFRGENAAIGFLETVRRLSCNSVLFALFSCKCEPSSENSLYYEDKNSKKLAVLSYELPKGTWLADSVTLLERLI